MVICRMHTHCTHHTRIPNYRPSHTATPVKAHGCALNIALAHMHTCTGCQRSAPVEHEGRACACVHAAVTCRLALLVGDPVGDILAFCTAARARGDVGFAGASTCTRPGVVSPAQRWGVWGALLVGINTCACLRNMIDGGELAFERSIFPHRQAGVATRVALVERCAVKCRDRVAAGDRRRVALLHEEGFDCLNVFDGKLLDIVAQSVCGAVVGSVVPLHIASSRDQECKEEHRHVHGQAADQQQVRRPDC